ncbi:MAG: D-2-hydroxyacid dehydrogenase [Gemmatimonadetes bacterium]|nr:D-2-hydroxyacid dehydrogenase [Gemmatimonadota bacterium]
MRFKLVMMPPERPVHAGWAARIRAEVPEVTVVSAPTLADARREIADAEAAFGAVPREVLPFAKKLRWLQAPAAAPVPPEAFYYPEIIEHPVVITTFKGIFDEHIGAHVMAYVLAFARGLHYYIPRQLEARWEPERRPDATVYLPESTALILGVGGIGAETARMCAAFGMRVIGTRRHGTQKPQYVDELYRHDELDRLLPEADFVISTVPHTPETEGMMNADRFRLMKRSAFFINIGRGMTVRLDDLVGALESGEIAGAGLDVFEIEPLPPDHPLWKAPNVLITPHTAAHGPYLDDRRCGILVENCRRFAAGEPLMNVADKALWF